MLKYDLHCHSDHSDGELAIMDLLKLASENKIDVLALTDHDCLTGLADAKLEADKYGVRLVNGLELSASWRGQLLHVIGLDIDPQNEVLIEGVKNNQMRRIDRSKQMIADFRSHGIDIEEPLKSVLKGAVPTRPHFAQALIDMGYAKDKKQAFKRFLVRGKPGFVPLEWPSIETVSTWIHEANGVAVLAHPMRYNFSRTKLVALIEQMKLCGMQGIEVSTPVTSPQQMKMLADLAIEHGLYASMGSDFHALDQPWAKLGSATALPEGVKPVWTLFD